MKRCCQGFIFVVAFGLCAPNNVASGRESEISMEVNIRSSVDNLTMSSYKVEPLPDSYAALGEGPHWDVQSQSLYYVDLEAAKLLRYDYQEHKVYKCEIEGEELASFVIPIQGQNCKFAVGCGRRVVIVTWDGISKKCKVDRVLFSVHPEEKYSVMRLNDAKCDPRGRLFAGTMRYVGDEFTHRWGELYKYEKGGKIEVVKSDVGISNGLAWNECKNKFYFVDTTDYEVKEYDYNLGTGKACNPKVIFNLRRSGPKEHLLPDGLTIDTNGNIYVATFNGHTIYKVNPSTGKVLLEIKLPCKQITSAAFGGPNLDILYVTTAAKGNEPEPSGTTYMVTCLGAKGLPMTKLQI